VDSKENQKTHDVVIRKVALHAESSTVLRNLWMRRLRVAETDHIAYLEDVVLRQTEASATSSNISAAEMRQDAYLITRGSFVTDAASLLASQRHVTERDVRTIVAGLLQGLRYEAADSDQQKLIV
jgi:hypothetical protein